MRVTRWPEILVIHLKRFFYDEKGTNKVVKKISYPEIFPVHVSLPAFKITPARLSSVLAMHAECTDSARAPLVERVLTRGALGLQVEGSGKASSSPATRNYALSSGMHPTSPPSRP